ncbi:DUF1700 domain-containing protein [Proteinivorax tanatarense]|uniref:DUF1700 domain-containing protein n=1 Tax=Proteinivorax tanatarense TaxID=1260629 RepID=A0AAU7VJJ7_9FIRM
MKKNEFLAKLRTKLRGLDNDSIDEITYDYEEHFSVGKEKGKNEEEIAESLGNPETIAAQYKYENALMTAKTSRRPIHLIKAILAGLALGLFNLIFVLGFYIAIVATLFAFFMASLAIAFSGGAMLFQVFLPFNLSLLGIPFLIEGLAGRITLFSLGIGTMALGLLLIIGVIKLGQLLFSLTLKYLQANISIVKKAGEDNAT